MAFVHLHNHTVFSMLDGATRIQDMVNRAVELGMPAVAITDHGYMYGVPDLALALIEYRLRPAFCDARVDLGHIGLEIKRRNLVFC